MEARKELKPNVDEDRYKPVCSVDRPLIDILQARLTRQDQILINACNINLKRCILVYCFSNKKKQKQTTNAIPISFEGDTQGVHQGYQSVPMLTGSKFFIWWPIITQDKECFSNSNNIRFTYQNTG